MGGDCSTNGYVCVFYFGFINILKFFFLSSLVSS